MGRKQKKYHYIYKTTNLLSGKYYIGMHSADNLDDGYLGSGLRLRRSINKYGEDNFKREILEFVDTRELLKQREEEVVTLDEIAKVDCMNLMVGGQGGFISDEHQKHRSECGGKALAERIKNDNVFAEKHRVRMSKSTKKQHENGLSYDINLYDWTGKKHSEETKEKMRKPKNVGENNSQYGSCWITNEIENKKIKRGDEIPKGWRLGRKIS